MVITIAWKFDSTVRFVVVPDRVWRSLETHGPTLWMTEHWRRNRPSQLVAETIGLEHRNSTLGFIVAGLLLSTYIQYNPTISLDYRGMRDSLLARITLGCYASVVVYGWEAHKGEWIESRWKASGKENGVSETYFETHMFFSAPGGFFFPFLYGNLFFNNFISIFMHFSRISNMKGTTQRQRRAEVGPTGRSSLGMD
jgi:hypothetical protein